MSEITNVAINLADVTPGFADPVFESQAVFRAILDAMAHPGTVTSLPSSLYPPVPHFQAQAEVALTMLDFETPVFVDAALGRDSLHNWLRFHCGCPVTENPAEAAFAFVGASTMPLLADFNQGDPKYPDRSTTVVIGCEALTGGAAQWLEGPGIAGRIWASPSGLPETFWAQMVANREMFPLGVDVILADETSVIALPRTVRVIDPAAEQEQ